ncbi:unnamed protein product, partial [Acanthoscelides obtectus]
GIFCKGWNEEWVVLYEDSTLAWYSDKGLSRPRGCVRISDAPELLAVGEYTRQVPRRPRFPKTCQIGQLLAIGSRAFQDVHWLMAQSPAEIKSHHQQKMCLYRAHELRVITNHSRRTTYTYTNCYIFLSTQSSLF